MSFYKLLEQVCFHPDRRIRTIITMLYCSAGIYVNFYMLQVFCIPVWWAAWMVIAFFLGIILFPFAGTYKSRLLAPVLGAGVPVCLYMIWFLADPWNGFLGYLWYVLLILFAGGGLLSFIPFYLLYHVYCYYRETDLINKRLMQAGIVVPFVVLLMYLFRFNAEYKAFDRAYQGSNAEQEFLGKLHPNHFTERILGIGFKYHTQLEYVFDGWRPPLHDPFLNIGVWLFADSSYPYRDMNRLRYYHKLFPEEPLNIGCPCSNMNDGRTYLKENWDKRTSD